MRSDSISRHDAVDHNTLCIQTAQCTSRVHNYHVRTSCKLTARVLHNHDRTQPRGAALGLPTADASTGSSRTAVIANPETDIPPQQRKKLFRQPLKYAKRSVREGAPQICRFHNYDPVNGCKRYSAKQCLLDHDHCHFCLQPGHPAHACADFLAAAV